MENKDNIKIKHRNKKKKTTLNIDISSNNQNQNQNQLQQSFKDKKDVVDNNILDNNLISDKLVNNITLKCMVNESQYKKYLSTTNNVVSENKNVVNNELLEFYKDRIINHVKNMLNKEYNNENEDLKEIFNLFLNKIIMYFQQQDTFDIYQESYINIDNNKDKNNVISNSNIHYNNYILNKKDVRTSILDEFVEKKTIDINMDTKSNKRFPKRKNINLSTPQLKTKGLK